MRHFKYTCDICKREYEYQLAFADKEREPLAKLPNPIGKDVCRTCMKIIKGFVDSIVK